MTLYVVIMMDARLYINKLMIKDIFMEHCMPYSEMPRAVASGRVLVGPDSTVLWLTKISTFYIHKIDDNY